MIDENAFDMEIEFSIDPNAFDPPLSPEQVEEMNKQMVEDARAQFIEDTKKQMIEDAREDFQAALINDILKELHYFN